MLRRGRGVELPDLARRVGWCAGCSHNSGGAGQPGICYSCIGESAHWVEDELRVCGICSQRIVSPSGACTNPLCAQARHWLCFNRAMAIACLDRGTRLYSYIWRTKDGVSDHLKPLARFLAQYVSERAALFMIMM